MTTLEIVLSVVLVAVTLTSLNAIIRYSSERFEGFEALLNASKAKRDAVRNGGFDRVLNVSDFNDWFNSGQDTHANPGIFLRLDKLSHSHLRSFISKKSGGYLDFDDFDPSTLNDFNDSIIKDWESKR